MMSVRPHQRLRSVARREQPSAPVYPFCGPHVSRIHAVIGAAPLPVGQPVGMKYQLEVGGVIGTTSGGGDGGGGEGDGQSTKCVNMFVVPHQKFKALLRLLHPVNPSP